MDDNYLKDRMSRLRIVHAIEDIDFYLGEKLGIDSIEYTDMEIYLFKLLHLLDIAFQDLTMEDLGDYINDN